MITRCGFFKYVYHVGCAIDSHSIINSWLILGSQILSNRQTAFFLPVVPLDRDHKDPCTIDLHAPHLARSMHKAWKKHQNTAGIQRIGLTSIFPFWKGWSSNRVDRTPSFLKKHFQTIVFRKLFGWKLEKYMRHLVLIQRFPWNMTWWMNWVQNLLNDQTNKLFKKSKSSHWSQPHTNPDHERTGQPVVGTGATQTCSSHDSKNFNVKVETNHEKTGKPLFAATQITRKVPPKNIFFSWKHNLLRWRLEIHDKTVKPVVRCDASHEQGHERSVHGLPNFWIATFCCEASWELSCSWISFEDREPPRSTCSSTRSTSVYNQFSATAKKWSRTLATSSCLNCSRRTLRRSAKHAYHTGVQVLFIAQAGIFLKNSGQSNFHWIHIGPSLHSKLRN